MQTNPSPFNSLLDLLIPLRCVKCGILVEDKPGLCPTCWLKVPFISKPFCACCGLPFEFEIDQNALCARCSYEQPVYTTARSVFAYTTESKDLILKFKHLDALSSVPLFAEWMANAIEERKQALCIPVPLHWTRLFMRTYNQAALLAQKLASLTQWTYMPSVLVRNRRTPSQGYLSGKDRKKNVARAFSVPQKKRCHVVGKTIILVDDVFTTGATLNACAHSLLKAGAKEVHALTLARVVRAQQFS